MVFGLAVRAAMRLGLHRDASHFPNISVFQGEMQRRMWSVILYMDLHTSLQVGLPRMIRNGMYDTRPPSNILDCDFNENSKVLPPEQPEVESTAIGYSNSKHSISKVLGLIVDQSNSTNPTTYEEAMKLDKMLHDAWYAVPEALKVRKICDLYVGSPVARLRKFGIDITFQKARCILHRKFFVTSPSASSYPYPYSVKACVEAAMRILQEHVYMHDQIKPGSDLHDERWRTSSLMMHDFLLAAMLICLYLGHRVSEDKSSDAYPPTEIRIKWTEEEMRQTIEASRKIWEETSNDSSDARKAAKAIGAMLAKLQSTGREKSNFLATTSEIQSNTLQSISFDHLPQGDVSDSTTLQQVAQTSWMPGGAWSEGFGQPSTSTPANALASYGSIEIDPLNWVSICPSITIAGYLDRKLNDASQELWDTQFIDALPQGWTNDGDFAFPDSSMHFMQWDQ